MLMSLWITLGGWRWIVLGLILLALELIAPGTLLLWLGIAAVAVGLVALVIDPGWQVELIAFAVLGLAAAVGWWFYGRPDNAAASDRPMLNRRAERHVGKVFTLDAPIVHGDGRLKIDDTTWRVSGPDLPAGAKVKVLGVEGITLVVAADS
ncbi:NfeD family protein [Chelatococcus sambhunathii]|uniref:NfeD family protein n=1 Tax=Chelatococcus sambhunathii TaxID=363953 RepID=A0ABU1DG82_9HYPH|nr:NfeD family protein [Chelatococcus sambhunathii]MDR4307133.1 NfeD family protein [Chelatococcus sambhunathii]